MINFELVTTVQEILIEKFGGLIGVREINSLDSALIRPFMTYEEQELYSSPIEKAAALVESLICNHPFIDGNKRVGYVILRYFLLVNEFDIYATLSEKYEFVMKIANGQLSKEQIYDWLSERVFQNVGE